MRILILGGTVFLGRALVEAASRSGHQVTLFNRGRSNPGLFPQVETIHGDRERDLSALNGQKWDAVIDTSGYLPRVVRSSAKMLADKADHYTFVSSVSVYSDFSQVGMDETAPLGSLPDTSMEEISGETYGPLKALCEQAVEDAMPGRVLVARPGLIVGPSDPTDRFTYWPHRVAQGGTVLAPGRPERGVQFIDVRDLAEWMLRQAEQRRTGVFNANGPYQPLPMGELLDVCREVSASQADFAWASETFLLEQGVEPWIEMPLWVPETDPQYAGFFSVSSQRAVETGLTFRSVAETVRDTLAWAASRPNDHSWRAGLTPEREASLLMQLSL